MSKSKTETSNPTSSKNSSSAVARKLKIAEEGSILVKGEKNYNPRPEDNYSPEKERKNIAKDTKIANEEYRLRIAAEEKAELKKYNDFWERVDNNTVIYHKKKAEKGNTEKGNTEKGNTEKENIEMYMKNKGWTRKQYYTALQIETAELDRMNKQVNCGIALSLEETLKKEAIYLTRQDRVANGVRLTNTRAEDMMYFTFAQVERIEGSQEFGDMKKLLGTKDSLAYLFVSPKDVGLALWANKVRPNGDWDFKPYINTYFTTLDEEIRTPYYYKGKDGHRYSSDISSNMIYGALGRMLGFTEEDLLTAGGVAQIVSDIGSDIASGITNSEYDSEDNMFEKISGAISETINNVGHGLSVIGRSMKNLFTDEEDESMAERVANLDNNGDQISIGLGFDFFDLIEKGEGTLHAALGLLWKADYTVGENQPKIKVGK